MKTAKEFHEKLHEFYEYAHIYSPQHLEEAEKINCVLVIDGNSLKFALSEIEE